MQSSGATEKFWFLDTLVRVQVPKTSNADGISVIEHLLPYGSATPLHIHHDEDEVFHVLEGKARFVVDGKQSDASAGQTLLAPRGSRHAFIVTSKQGARWLTITRGNFERLVRAAGRPAERDALPVVEGPPSAEQIKALEAACRHNGIEIVGPPLPLPA